MQASWLLHSQVFWWAQGSEISPKMTILPSFGVFSAFSFETSKNLTDFLATGVKQLNSVGKNQNVCKWPSPDEIRVWQLPLFIYLFIENEKISKDKDTNFILMTSPSDRPLSKTQIVKPVTRRNAIDIRYVKQKTLKSWKVKETLKSRQKTLIVIETKDFDDLWKRKERKTLIVFARQQTLIVLESKEDCDSLDKRLW